MEHTIEEEWFSGVESKMKFRGALATRRFKLVAYEMILEVSEVDGLKWLPAKQTTVAS